MRIVIEIKQHDEWKKSSRERIGETNQFKSRVKCENKWIERFAPNKRAWLFNEIKRIGWA